MAARFLISEAAGESFPLARADGGAIPCQPATGSGGNGALVLIFPTIAALEAYNASSPQVLQQGQLAVVQSNNSLWELAPGSEGDVDNITIASVTAPPFANANWMRVNVSLSLPTYLAQRTWVVDPTAPTNADERSGLTALTALKTYAEVYRRWGYTWEPNLKGVGLFSVQSLHASTDGSDPTSFAPFLENGASFSQFAALQAPSFTGTLNVVTAKNTATNTALHSTFTTTTGAVVSGTLLVNATRGNSRALAVTDTGGGVFLLTQPLTPYAGGFPSATEVDTWAHGDAITGFAPVQVDIARVGARHATLDGSFDPAHLVQDIAIIDGNQNFGPLLVDSLFAVFEDCGSARSFQPTDTSTFVTENCDFILGVQMNGGGGGSFVGGWIGATNVASNIAAVPGGALLLAGDIILLGLPFVSQAPIGPVYVDTTATLQVEDVQVFGALYGPGTVDVVAGSLRAGTSAAANLPIANKQLNGATTGYSRHTGGANVVTVFGSVPLTTANLDATPASATAFAGYAEGGGAVISIAGAQP